MESSTWLVAYTYNNQKTWEVVYGYGAVETLTQTLVNSGVSLKDIVIGEVPEAFLENKS